MSFPPQTSSVSPSSASLAGAINIQLLEDVILPQVFKPGRYLGLEQGAFRKDPAKAEVMMALAFPELYEIGISSYGHKLLYSLINHRKDFLCDRVYAPAPDFRQKLAEYAVPLFGVETRLPLNAFDLVAFSLQYELNYTTLLGMLESAQIPLRAAERETYPVILAGGPGSTNPMPLVPFFDGFIIGDGEEILVEILDLIRQAKKEKSGKPALLQELARLEGMYIPGLTQRVYKRITDIAAHDIELAPLIPTVGAVHDRVTIEARRGCDRMCRFCQPCFINLPVREQSIEKIKESALKEIEKTGYEECSLLSLSIADYSYFKPLILEVTDALRDKNVSLSLPSQRADRFSLEVAEAVQNVRKSTLTFAPEAGTARLRDVVNKNLTDAEIMNAVTTAYRAGWNKVKLYFMIGLPTETDADLDGIVDTVRRMQQACLAIKREPGLSIKNHLEINLTLSNFVPKPHTPFQWFPQDSMEMLYRKRNYLRTQFRGMRGVKLNFTDPEISKLEAAIAKGGEELAAVIESAYRKGGYLDAWDDILNFSKWFEAFQEQGIDVEAYTRERLVELIKPLPWDCIDVGLDKKWLQEEYRRATEAAGTAPCFEACSTCGVCGTYSTWPKFTPSPINCGITPHLKGGGVNPSKKRFVASPLEGEAESVGDIRSLTDSGEGEIHNCRPKLLPVCKVRIKIQKMGRLRFISHLDWLRMIHRTLSRSGLPVAYTQGFNPKPKTSFSPALPIFTESLGEFIDIEMTEKITQVGEKMNRFLPEGGKVIAETTLPAVYPSIDKSISTVTYIARWTCNDSQKRYTIRKRVIELASQSSLIYNELPGDSTRPNIRILDLAPYLSALEMQEDDTLLIRLNYRQKDWRNENGGPASIKPKWILDLIDSSVQWSLTRAELSLESSINF